MIEKINMSTQQVACSLLRMSKCCSNLRGRKYCFISYTCYFYNVNTNNTNYNLNFT
jgi:hypothetical protein